MNTLVVYRLQKASIIMDRFTIDNLLALKTRLSAECQDHLGRLLDQRGETQRQIDDLKEKGMLSEEISRYAILGLNAETSKKHTAFERKRELELGRKCLRELVS